MSYYFDLDDVEFDWSTPLWVDRDLGDDFTETITDSRSVPNRAFWWPEDEI